VQQIADWLEKLGMSEYAQRFAENRIDLSVLPDLTDLHLKDLGVPLGDRLNMLRAIRELGGAPAAAQAAPIIIPALTTSAVAPQIAAQDAAAKAAGERRQVTVMFCDVEE
jgi:hypothetical protein